MRLMRRDLLAAMTCAAGALPSSRTLALGNLAGSASLHLGSIIDVHSHPSIALYRDLVHNLDTLKPDQVFPDRLFFPARFPEWTPARAIKAMDQNGIRAQILSLPDATVLLRGTFAQTTARKINEAMAAIVTEHPTRFGAFGVVPHDDPLSTIAEIGYALDVLKLDGICMPTNIRGAYLGDPALDLWFEELNRRSAVVFVHPVAPQSAKPPPAVFLEFCFDTTRMITNMVLSGAKRRFSQVKIVAAHGGGAAPYLSHRLELLEPLLGHSHLSSDRIAQDMRSFYFDMTTCMSKTNLLALRSFVGAERLLMGFDTPYVTSDLVPPELRRFDAFEGFSWREKQMVRDGNALPLFPRLKQV